jgi:uncharacterized protein GlcG (DUF336 family)
LTLLNQDVTSLASILSVHVLFCFPGVPIKRDDAVIGGIDVSGGTSEEDEECAVQALIVKQFTVE